MKQKDIHISTFSVYNIKNLMVAKIQQLSLYERLDKKQSSGRPKKSTDRAERAIYRVARRQRFSTLREIKQDISDTNNLSNSSIRGTLHKHGLFSRQRKANLLFHSGIGFTAVAWWGAFH